MDDGREQISAHLGFSERLVWTGRPDPGVLFTSADWFIIPLSLLWSGFSVFWEVSVITSRAPAFFRLWGIPFLVVGVYFVAGRFVYKRWRKTRTAYGLTDHRAIVVVGDRYVQDGPVQGVAKVVRRSRDGGHLSVTFDLPRPRLSRRQSWPGNTGMEIFGAGRNQPLAFYDVPDPDRLLLALGQRPFNRE